MKFEAGKTYKTRGGEEAFIYCVDAPGACPIHGRIENDMVRWTESGNMIASHKHSYDLIAPESERISRKVWVSVYENDPPCVHSTKENAERYARKDALRIGVPCFLTEITE
jgi:hypothetical protein